MMDELGSAHLLQLSQSSITDLPDEILIIIFEVDLIYVDIVALERTCHRFHDLIHRKLTTINEAGDGINVDWLLQYESLINLNDLLDVINDDMPRIKHRRFTQLHMLIDEPFTHDNKILLAQMLKNATDVSLYNISLEHNYIGEFGILYDTDTLTINDDCEALELFVNLYGPKVQKLYVSTESDIRNVIRFSDQLQNVRSVCVMGNVHVELLSQLNDVIKFTKLTIGGGVAFQLPCAQALSITKLVGNDTNLWTFAKPWCPLVTHLVVNSDSGDARGASDVQNVVINYRFGFEKKHMQFMHRAYKAIMLGTRVTRVTFKVDDISASNFDPYEITVRNLEKLRERIMQIESNDLDLMCIDNRAEYKALLPLRQ